MSSSVGALRQRVLTYREARSLPPIPSGYRTDRRYVLARNDGDGEVVWRLSEESLAEEFVKEYDGGTLDEWMESYADTADPAHLHFLAAYDGEEALALLTWQYLRWNNTIWLVDIRTAEDSRRAGLGSSLLRSLQDTAQRERMRGITVETQTANYPAIRFYRKHGFFISGLNDHLYSDHDLADGDVALFLYWGTR